MWPFKTDKDRYIEILVKDASYLYGKIDELRLHKERLERMLIESGKNPYENKDIEDKFNEYFRTEYPHSNMSIGRFEVRHTGIENKYIARDYSQHRSKPLIVYQEITIDQDKWKYWEPNESQECEKTAMLEKRLPSINPGYGRVEPSNGIDFVTAQKPWVTS